MIELLKIQSAVEKGFDIDYGSLLKKDKTRALTDARAAFCLLAVQKGYSKYEITKYFDKFDRTSIYAMLERGYNYLSYDKTFYAKIINIKKELDSEYNSKSETLIKVVDKLLETIYQLKNIIEKMKIGGI